MSEPALFKVRERPSREREWLREGIEIALRHLQEGRVTLAIDALKATLSKETW